jgi:hypothetical protein
MRLVRSKRKDVARVPEDLEELKRLGQELDRAVEEFNVRTFLFLESSLVPHMTCQVTFSIRAEIVLEDVRALALSMSKRIEETNYKTSRDATNGV